MIGVVEEEDCESDLALYAIGTILRCFILRFARMKALLISIVSYFYFYNYYFYIVNQLYSIVRIAK